MTNSFQYSHMSCSTTVCTGPPKRFDSCNFSPDARRHAHIKMHNGLFFTTILSGVLEMTKGKKSFFPQPFFFKKGLFKVFNFSKEHNYYCISSRFTRRNWSFGRFPEFLLSGLFFCFRHSNLHVHETEVCHEGMFTCTIARRPGINTKMC